MSRRPKRTTKPVVSEDFYIGDKDEVCTLAHSFLFFKQRLIKKHFRKEERYSVMMKMMH